MKAINFLLICLLALACSSLPEIDPKKDPIGYGLHSKRDEFRSCYLESESYKGKDAVTEGTIKVGFTVDKSGYSTEEKITETSFKDPNLNVCILSILQLIKFPVPHNGETVVVSHPINFYPTYE